MTDKQSKKDGTERMTQSDMPIYTLQEALKIPEAINDHFGGKEATPLDLAGALGRSPASSGWRLLTSASVSYGITLGSYNATKIALTELGSKIMRPIEEGEDKFAKIQALLRPRILKTFYEKYDGAKVPKEEIGKNVLRQMGLPIDRVDVAWKIIIENAKYVGILKEIQGSYYIQLKAADLGLRSVTNPSMVLQDPLALGSSVLEIKSPLTGQENKNAVNDTPVMQIVKGELGIAISLQLQSKAWRNKALGEKVQALFDAADAVAEEWKKGVVEE